jgi:hypothetical protein
MPLVSQNPQGVIAQLGERYNGIVEVRGSIPRGSTITHRVALRHSSVISIPLS